MTNLADELVLKRLTDRLFDCLSDLDGEPVEGVVLKDDAADILEWARQLSALRREEWQGIETAPKDGSAFLAFGWWSPSDKDREPCWAVFNRYDDSTYVRSFYGHAAHWRPLPPPPKGTDHE